jgi:5'(3')-deoxyribonucleotidase
MSNFSSTSDVRRSSDSTIALDLDGVCSKTRPGFLDKIRNIYNISIPQKRLYRRNLMIPEITQSYGKEVSDIVRRDPSFYEELDKIEGSKIATEVLSKNYEIKIVSSRFSTDWLDDKTRKKVYKSTKKWLDDKGYEYDEIINPIDAKKEVKADVFIDDAPEVISDVSTKSYSILFLRPHNTNNIPRTCWNATKSVGDNQSILADNSKKQWKIIENHLKSDLHE